MNHQKGFGLPEVMISLLLSSLIITLLMNQYISMKQHYIQLQSSMEEAMELQLAGDFIRESVRQAGFTPCLRLDHLMTVDTRNGHTSLSAIDVDADLTIHRMNPYFNDLLSELNSTRILVTHYHTLRDDRPILIADCYHAEVHRVIHVSNTAEGQMVTLASPLVFTYQKPVYVGEWLHERFFIRPHRGLFYQHETTDELTPLVKTMSIKMNGHVVLIKLGLGDEQALNLETRVRA